MRPSRPGSRLATLHPMSVLAEILASGLSAALGAAFGAWYWSRAGLNGRPSAGGRDGAGDAPDAQRTHYLSGRQDLYEEFFAVSSAAFLAVGNYQMAKRHTKPRPTKGKGRDPADVALDDLGRRAEDALDHARRICYRLEMRTIPSELVEALREYVESLKGILELPWIPVEMHLSEERVRRIMRADLAFDFSPVDGDGAGTDRKSARRRAADEA
jgi:hypothetical protein